MTNARLLLPIPEELTPSAQVGGDTAGDGQRVGGCHKHPANTNLLCSPPSFLLCFPAPCPAWRAKSSLLFKIHFSTVRSQTKFVSPEIIMLPSPLVWAERCLWDLHLLINFIKEKNTERGCTLAIHCEMQLKFNFTFFTSQRGFFLQRAGDAVRTLYS